MDPLVKKVAQRYAAIKATTFAVVSLPDLDPKAAEILEKETLSRKMTFKAVPGGVEIGVGARTDISKERLFKNRIQDILAMARQEANREGITEHGLGSVFVQPKISFPSFHNRQQETGRYLHTKWTRLCRCGHPVGVHSAEKGKDGYQPCFAGDLGYDCDCEKFRRTEKFMSDEEYEVFQKGK